MPQGQLNQLTDLGHLLADATNIVVPNLIQPFLFLTLDRLALAVNLSVWSHNAVGRRLALTDLELNTTHAAPDQEGVILQNEITSCIIVEMKSTKSMNAYEAHDAAT